MKQSILCHAAAALLYLGTLDSTMAQPHITTQPANQSVSLGATVTETVQASSVGGSLHYQWRFNDVEIVGATSRLLTLTNIQLANAGAYSVVVTNLLGTATSRTAMLDVDPAFTLMSSSPIATETALAVSASWSDYDGDGYLDLLIGNAAVTPSFLYHNKGDGTFERVLTNVLGGLGSGGGPWADYDNDGLPDLYTMTARGLGSRLYHNQGNGTLLWLTNAAVIGPIVSDHSPSSGSAAWVDFNNDGFLDVFVANGGFVGNLKSYLYQNQGNGTFAKITAGVLVNELRTSWSGAWVDYDDDGLPDLFVANTEASNELFHNDGPNGFSKVTAAQAGSIVLDGIHSRGAAWGDYNNDGFTDLFVSGTTNLLYRNNGNGSFTRITTSGILPDVGGIGTAIETIGATWVDYDNDGYLDLFTVSVNDNDFLYHNNGDGTFTRILTGSLVNDGTVFSSVDCAWADYDNDGFQDLVVVGNAGGNNALFHNNGNKNHWINLRLVGTASNRSAIGAKVRLKATIGGKTFWQRGDITAGGGLGSQSDIRASFGLGDATNIDTVRIEWPSGTVQELHDVGVKQFLTITEPARLEGHVVNGQYQLNLNGGVGFTYQVQSTTDLTTWTPLTTVTTTNMTMPIVSLDPTQARRQYFRALRQ